MRNSEFCLEECLEELDAEVASWIPHSLDFIPAMQHKKLEDFSGSWKMWVALARAFFIQSFLLLQEPTNHLD